jgi:hypothetical protein
MGYVDAVLADGAVGFWALDDLTGTIAKGGVGGLDGTYSGAYTLAQPRLNADGAGKAAVLSGGVVTIANNAVFSSETTAITLEAIIKPSTLSGSNSIQYWAMSKGASSNYEWAFGPRGDGTVCCFIWPLTGASNYWYYQTPAGLVTTSAAAHIAVAWTNGSGNNSIGYGTGAIYVNGVAQTLSVGPVATFASTAPAAGTAAVLIGGRADSAATNLQGTIQDCAIYPTALTAAQIARHYQESLRGGVSY